MDEKINQTESSDITTHLDTIEKLVVLWDPSIYQLPLLRGHYFHTVDEVISLSTSARCSPEHLQTRSEKVLEITMSRLEDMFCRLMMRNHFIMETELALILEKSEANHRSYRINTITSDHYNRQSDIVLANSHTNSAVTTPQSNSDYNTHSSTSPISFSSYSAEHPDEYHSALEDRFGTIVDASEIFVGDIFDLKAIADRMIRANHLAKLMHAFVTTCSEIVTNDFSLMGFRELTKDEAEILSWDALSHEMKNWVRVTRFTFQVMLPRKRWLCDEVFGTEMHNTVFDEAAKSSVMRLIKFAKAASHRKGSAKIIFHLLSMYETLMDALAGARKLFADAPDKSIYREIEGTIHELGNTVLQILPVWLEDLAQNDLSHMVEGKEGIDIFTKYAMSYILLLVVNHRHSLNLLLHDELVTRSDVVLQVQSEMTPLGHKILALISYLKSVLEHKSKNMEPGIQEIFLINNLCYVLDSVKDSELKVHLKDDWSRDIEEQISKLCSRYLRSSWGNVMEFLNDKISGRKKGLMLLVPSNKAAFAFHQKVKRFNLVFETACNLQSSWKVPDPQLRQELRTAISHTILPIYNSFLEENHHFVSFGVDLVMYTAKALEDRIFDLFEGS
jgi:exocyst complex component 7